jgi:RNA polymerase sigma-70 factor (ECF subfamily)
MRELFQPSTWQAFWEHVVEDRPAPEVAARLGVTVNAVFKAKARVLARLHRELADLTPE